MACYWVNKKLSLGMRNFHSDVWLFPDRTRTELESLVNLESLVSMQLTAFGALITLVNGQ